MDPNQEDRWKALEESLLLDGITSTLGESEGLPATIPKKEKKKTRRNPKPKDEALDKKAAQPAFSEADFERQLQRYKQIDNDTEEMDFKTYLQDDDDDNLPISQVLGTDFTPIVEGMEELDPEHSNSAIAHQQDFQTDNTATTTEAGATSVQCNEEDSIVSTIQQQDGPTSQPTQTSQTPVRDDLFYWLEAKEIQFASGSSRNDHGSVFLFGKYFSSKVGNYVSCCVRVKNVERVTFLLPKDGASDIDVLTEINTLCKRQGIERRRIKFVERYYCFEDASIPREKSRWAKLRFSGALPPFPSQGPFEHIQCVMGSSTSLLELFLIKRKLKGPCFLRISQLTPTVTKVSHCALEFVVDSPKSISVESSGGTPPPLTLASIQLHTQLDDREANTEVVIASVALYENISVDKPLSHNPSRILTGIRPLTNHALPLDLGPMNSFLQIHPFKSERSLLTWLTGIIKQFDPDMLIGHNFVGFTLNILLHRFRELNVPEWSAIGRLHIKSFPLLRSGQTGTTQERDVCCGRLIVDSYYLSKEHFKSTNYKLRPLATEMGIKVNTSGDNAEFDPCASRFTPKDFMTASQIRNIVSQVCHSCVLSVAVVSHLDVIRLTKRLCAIAGNLWSRTLYGARSERIEYLLLHAFHGLKFIVPDKKSFEQQKRSRELNEENPDELKRKAKYQGGMVLAPKCGLYTDFTLLLDFNSLYPSLIQEFNICFSTVDRFDENHEVDVPPLENLICRACSALRQSPPCPHKCVLPRVIKHLVDQRREVKRLMKTEKDTSNLSLLEIRQKALKLTANSMYGCLGFEFSRFFAQPLAELVTRQGRLALQKAVELVPQVNSSLQVIYGDTDSVMIETGVKKDIGEVLQIGLQLKNEINKNYHSLEIDIDGVFRSILLLKKKKYAALSVQNWEAGGTNVKKEVKGLDMVRRDWCPLARKTSDSVLNRILNADGEDALDFIMKYMQSVAENVRKGDVYPMTDFVISKSLTKEPEAYKGTCFPHVTVALRMKKRKEIVRVGDLIPYVVCSNSEGEATKSVSDRSFHIDEASKESTLTVDTEWYLSSQIYPPVMRLCEHIQGFTNAQLSEVMGLQYNEVTIHARNDVPDAHSMDFAHCTMFKFKPLSECFPDALQLQVTCTNCLKKVPIEPHERVKSIVLQQRENRKVYDHSTNGNRSMHFPLYVCTSCGRPIPITYVANCLAQLCHRIFAEFYQCGGSLAAVRAIRSQFTYFRALFDVPYIGGAAPDIIVAHRCQALRCIGTAGGDQLYTLAEAEEDEMKPDSDKRYIVDPILICVESLYKRIEQMMVNMDQLFR